MTPAEIEARALAISKRQEQAVLAADALQDISNAPEVPEALRDAALRLHFAAVALSRDLEAERRRVRATSSSCQDVAAFGPTRPPPPPPPPGAVAEPAQCGTCDGTGVIMGDPLCGPCWYCQRTGARS